MPLRPTHSRFFAACALFAMLLHSQAAWSQQYTAQEAAQHIGEKATVCGVVVSAKFAVTSRGQPTFLNLDRPYPDQVFTVVIWGADRSKFGQPEIAFSAKQICVTGWIAAYKGRPEIIAKDPVQITAP